MNKLIIIFLLMFFWSCQDKKEKIQGVWYTVDFSLPDQNYIEAHITDTAFVVVNDLLISYMTSYELKYNTLVQHNRDVYNDFIIMDTLTFKIKFAQDSMFMVNAINPNAYSKWKKIPDLEPFNFFGMESLAEFAVDFKNRYKKNYLEIYEPENIKSYLKNFDNNWIEK